MKLNEIVVTSKDEDWDKIELLNAMGVGDWKIQADGSVKVFSAMSLEQVANRYVKDGKMGLQFASVNGNFRCEMPKLRSCEGFPHLVTGTVTLLFNEGMSWDGFTEKIGSNLRIQTTQGSKISLVGIGENLKQMSGQISCKWDRVVEGGLGLMNIKGFVQLMPNIVTDGLPRPFQIIYDHIMDDGSIFECQAQLIEEGFEEFAKL